jgi:hypothetical protein
LAGRIQVLDRDLLGRGEVTVAGLLARLRALKDSAGARRAVVVIDYLQLLPVSAEAARRGDLEADRAQVKFVQDLQAGTRGPDNPDGDAVLVISEAASPRAGGPGAAGWPT